MSGDNVLLVAGRPNLTALGRDIEIDAAGDDRINLCLRELTAEEVAVYVAAADLIVLPYLEVLNSGAALLALSFERPILVPARGALPELQQEFGDAWVRTYEGDLDVGALQDAMEWAGSASGRKAPDLETRDWKNVGTQTMDAYLGVISLRDATDTREGSR